ncbi:MAG: DUF3887 domain-containing protein, partial [Bacteroidia bacterium]|nr:DUF3887 domain-containing protein [Bacteroidia bacterium]
MKNIFILISFLSIFNAGFSQIEKDNYKQVSTKFVSFFNESKNDSIVAMFSPEMYAALPIDKFTQVSVGLKSQLGSIKKIRFVRLQSASALYETTFENEVLGMTITLNPKNEIAGLLFRPYIEAKEIIRNTTKMKLPFKGEWSVTWGGDTKEQNYHVESIAQKNAFDFLIYDQAGLTHKGSGASNEDYYAFGKELYA